MPVVINGSEQAVGSESVVNFQLELPAERITTKQLIRSRVFQKVKDFNASKIQREATASEIVVPPDEAELALNGQPDPSDRLADFETEFERAIKAFHQKQVLILVDGKQLTDLNADLQINHSTDVSFIRLTMLAGG